MSCYIEGHPVTAVFDPSANHSSLPAGPLDTSTLPASVPVLVTVAFGDRQFSCSHQLRLEDRPYVVLGLDWFALFREYALSTGACPSVASRFAFDGNLLSTMLLLAID